MIILLIFLVFLIFLLFGAPLITALGLSTLFPIFFGESGAYTTEAVSRWIVQGADSITVISIPMFILAGAIMSKGGIAKKIFDVFAYFVGGKRAGLLIATIFTCLFYGAISGSGVATAAAVGGMTLPILMKLGYDKVFCASLIAVAGSLGVVIPPSIPFVIYGSITGTSVSGLFTAGILPGSLIGSSLCIYTWFYCKKHGEDKEKIDAMVKELKSRGLFNILKESFWAILSPVIILGGIYSGIVTPTEAAVVSVIYSLLISIFVYKTIKFSEIIELVRTAISQFAGLVLLLALATSFSRALTVLQGSKIIGDFIINYISYKYLFLLILNILLFIMGMFMDVGPVVAILGPILLPAAVELGISPIHMGIIMVCNLAVGMVTPPFGMNLFVVSPMVEKSSLEVGKSAIPFIGAFIIALVLITYVPAISLLLVR
ncbi:TRAP transporter large permease [Peptoniphilus grossensis]|uniref:TRAP transporter large permease n=1 Tax=Peptoniphilus grossensis TaxID=1465756 RepID=A0ABU7X9P7_9FIRM